MLMKKIFVLIVLLLIMVFADREPFPGGMFH